MSRLLLCFLACFACSSLVTEAQVADPDPGRFSEEIRTFTQWDTKNSFPDNSILFVGSSSIRFWQTATRFPELTVINRGFGGSHISDVLHYLGETTLKYAPNAIVFYAGDNDIAGKKTPERVLRDYQQFVERVQTALPDTPIIFIAIKPSLSRWGMWPAMQDANALIEAFSKDSPSLHYADIATPMLGSTGEPKPELFVSDGLHLSTTGYDLWTQILKPLIERAQRDVEE